MMNSMDVMRHIDNIKSLGMTQVAIPTIEVAIVILVPNPVRSAKRMKVIE